MRYDKIPDAAGVALPGSLGLDADLSGMVVDSCITDPDGTLLVSLKGGEGRFIDTDEDVLVTVASTEGAPLTAEIIAAFPDGDPALTRELVRTLERWRDQSNPVRMCAGPGLITLLIAGQEDWLVIPRREFPDPT